MADVSLIELLTESLPVWASLLAKGGALVFAWEATRFPRDRMLDLVESACTLAACTESPYDRLGHRVDRVIKQRDILVAVRT